MWLRRREELCSATKLGRSLAWALLVVACVSILTAVGQKTGAKTTEDLPAGAMQAKATTACTECHEARIIVQQRLSKAAWTKEVDKMVKWGAVVDANDRDALIDYLSTNFGPEKPAYDAPRSSALREKASQNVASKK